MMKSIKTIESISEVHQFFGLGKPKHPLISIIRLYEGFEVMDIERFKYSIGLYQISLKNNCPFTIANYGRNSYDFQEGTMVFTAPYQVLEYDKNSIEPNGEGWTILFHPDLIQRSALGKNIQKYSFFSYASHEALHLSEEEQQSITAIMQKIENEYKGNIDAHSQTLIISNLELMLNYCTRFYDRQFFTRTNFNQDIVTKFELLLQEYYSSGKPLKMGIPTVQHLGDALNISPKYLSDLLRKETGANTQEHLHRFMIQRAKNMLLNSEASVSEIAYELGFEYPQYFSKIFKKRTQMSPREFRNFEAN